MNGGQRLFSFGFTKREGGIEKMRVGELISQKGERALTNDLFVEIVEIEILGIPPK